MYIAFLHGLSEFLNTLYAKVNRHPRLGLTPPPPHLQGKKTLTLHMGSVTVVNREQTLNVFTHFSHTCTKNICKYASIESCVDMNKKLFMASHLH
jgi:hypothetical protein